MAPTSCLIFRRDLNTVAIALFHRFSGPIVWYTSWLDADIKSYKSLQFAGVPNAFALMLLIWIAIFTSSHEEAERSLGRAISDAMTMTSMPAMTQDLDTPRILDEF